MDETVKEVRTFLRAWKTVFHPECAGLVEEETEMGWAFWIDPSWKIRLLRREEGLWGRPWAEVQFSTRYGLDLRVSTGFSERDVRREMKRLRKVGREYDDMCARRKRNEPAHTL